MERILIVKRLSEYLFLWALGGTLYYSFEMMFRGFSHWSMFLLGGICLVFFAQQGMWTGWTAPLWKQVGWCVIFVTACEFITGILVNKVMHWNVWDYTDQNFATSKYFDDFRDLFVVNLDTSARLTICYPPQNIRRDENKNHPIHYAAFDSEYRKWLSSNFKKAFDVDLTPNTQYGAEIPLCMGEPVKLTNEYEDEQTRLEAYAKILESYKQVQNQGDGIKSFTGILLYLMLDYYRIYLFDEP